MNKQLLNRLYRLSGQNQDNLEVLLYGQSVFLFNGFLFLCIFIEGIMFKQFLYTLIWIFMFTILRSQLGGYHCKTMVQCFITTHLVYFSGYFLHYYQQKILTLVMIILIFLLMCLFVKQNQMVEKKRVFIIIVGELILGIMIKECLFPAIMSICQNIIAFLIKYKKGK